MLHDKEENNKYPKYYYEIQKHGCPETDIIAMTEDERNSRGIQLESLAFTGAFAFFKCTKKHADWSFIR